VPFAVAHRRAYVEQHVADEVRLQLVLLDEVFLARVIDPPIDVFRIIARHVFTVSSELHSETSQRRFMRSRQIAYHQTLWLQVPIGDMAEDIGVDVTGKDGIGHIRGDWSSGGDY